VFMFDGICLNDMILSENRSVPPWNWKLMLGLPDGFHTDSG